MLNKVEPLVYLSFFAYLTMLEGYTFISYRKFASVVFTPKDTSNEPLPF